MPWPFQLDMIYKGIRIDKLLVCSNLQKQIFINNYFWPKKILKTIPSLRFDQLKKRKKTIFLPFDLTEDDQKLLDGFKTLISKISFDIKKYEISIHPLKKLSEKHINFKNELLMIIKNSKSNFKTKTDDPIIFSHPVAQLQSVYKFATLFTILHLINYMLSVREFGNQSKFLK